MDDIQKGDIVQSKKYQHWKGEVIRVHEKNFGYLISWFAPKGGHIRTWAYKDDVFLLQKAEPAVSRYEKAILDRQK